MPRRRRLAPAAGGGYALGARGASCGDDGGATRREQVVPFYGAHQAGIATPAQDRLHFAAFDVVDGVARADLRELLRTWTDAPRRG